MNMKKNQKINKIKELNGLRYFCYADIGITKILSIIIIRPKDNYVD